MGLKCSVIGHKYGETAVERDREEQGSEVVITIQESETCERCGKTRVISENKEVTSIETPSDIAGDMIAEEEQAESAPGEAASTPEAGDAEVIDDDRGVPAGGDSEPEEPSTASVTETEEGASELDPEEDDGIIIDGDTDDGGVDDDRAPGEWPSEPGQDDDDWEPETGAAEQGADEGTQAVEPFGGNGVTVPSGKFRCPECEFTTDVASSSLRAGDFCPECHKGALVSTAE